MTGVYYWRTRQNFGDALAPLLLRRFSRINAEWAPPESADIVLVGSLLDHLKPEFTGIIAGAGKLHEETNLRLPNANILALRGPLTAKGIKGDYVLGDPGLLADELAGPISKDANLGIVPHWTDTVLEHDPRFLPYRPKIIRVTDDPIEVIRQIGSCKKIVSSSLHGIIIADAFGIPRRTELAPRMISHPGWEGNDFKFRDYNASVGVKFELGRTQEADYNTVVELQHQLFDMMHLLRSFVRGSA